MLFITKLFIVIILAGCCTDESIDRPYNVKVFTKYLSRSSEGKSYTLEKVEDLFGKPDRIIKIKNITNELGAIVTKEKVSRWNSVLRKNDVLYGNEIWQEDQSFLESYVLFYCLESPVLSSYRLPGPFQPKSSYNVKNSFCFLKKDNVCYDLGMLTWRD